MKLLGIVIVTWNSEDVIDRCLNALKNEPNAQIVVIDNASADQTAERAKSHPGIQVVRNEANLGFAGGVNQGVRLLETPYVLILNPDCEVQSDLAAMIEAARDGAAGGILLGADGQPQRGFQFRRFPTPAALAFEALGLNRLWKTNPVNVRYRCLDVAIEEEISVDQPPGAFFLFRRDAFETIGGFNLSYWPVWFEDVDFCRRLVNAGYTIRFTPFALARHQGAASISKIRWSSKELAWYGSLLRYATQHYGWLSRRLVGLAVAAASVPRSLTGIQFRRQSAHTLGVYARVLLLALKVVVYGRVDVRHSDDLDILDDA